VNSKRIEMIEYLQVGYKPKEFEEWGRELVKRPNKTAVDPKPTVNKYWKPKGDAGGQQHHVFLETFIEFTRYIPNKYDVIEFTYSPTMYELKQAEKILTPNGKVVF